MTRTLVALGLFTLIAFAAPAGGADAPKNEAQKNGDAYSVQVTPEMQRHSRILDTLYFAGTVYGFLTLAIVLVTGLSKRMRDAAARLFRKPFLIVLAYYVLFSIVMTILTFPLDYYSGFIVPHQFHLSTQTLGSWLGDNAKEFLLGIVLGGPLAALALWAIRKFDRWWIPLWLGSLPLIVLLVVIAPIFIDPLFNKFEPLQNAQLKQQLLDEASRAGIEGSRVYQVNKSKQTTTMNAYVTGLGPTKRIVLWDTTLQKMTPDEILAIMGHEMGHYVLNHIWKGLAFGVVVSLIICWLAFQMFERGLARWGARWGVQRKDDPAALPWLLIIVSAVSFILSPVINGYSRHIEHEADIFGLELTHSNDAMARSFVKFATDSKVDPTPNAFIEFWRYSHPSLTKRIEFVRNYKPWEHGQPNAAYKP